MIKFAAILVLLSLGASVNAQIELRLGARDHADHGLYRARDGNWYVICYVTPDGIILGDALNNAFAAWLKRQLDERFDGGRYPHSRAGA